MLQPIGDYLEKKCGGVHPITVGCTLRHLVAKLACIKVVTEMAQLLAPYQLSYGVLGGIEAAGLILNQAKCEIISQDMTTFCTLLFSLAGAQLVSPSRT